jgi:hypothetical protein
MTDRRPTAQEAGDALCAAWGRAFVAAHGRAARFEVTYRRGMFHPLLWRKADIIAITDRLWARARENATMKDSK